MALFRNLGACPVECEAYSSGVNLRDCLCDVLQTYYSTPPRNPLISLTLRKIAHF